MIPPLIIYILDMKHFRREWDIRESETLTKCCSYKDDTALIVCWPFLLRN